MDEIGVVAIFENVCLASESVCEDVDDDEFELLDKTKVPLAIAPNGTPYSRARVRKFEFVGRVY